MSTCRFLLLLVEDLSRSLVESDVHGLFFDLLKFLLTAIFNLQEEEDEEPEEDDDANVKSKDMI